MAKLHRIGVEQRRSRLGIRRHLVTASRASSAVEVAQNLVGLHGTDPASVFLAVRATLVERGRRVDDACPRRTRRSHCDRTGRR
jgi:hypothetical protein